MPAWKTRYCIQWKLKIPNPPGTGWKVWFSEVFGFPVDFKEGNLKAKKKEEEKSGPIWMFGFPRIPVFWVFSILSFHCTVSFDMN